MLNARPASILKFRPGDNGRSGAGEAGTLRKETEVHVRIEYCVV